METENKSQFNSGVGQVIEIRKLQNILNMTRLDPLAMSSFDEFPSKMNYEITLQIITSLFFEVRPKCSEKEREEISNTKKAVELFIQRHPPIKSNNKGDMVMDKFSLNQVIKILENYETLVRSALDKHELNSPSKSDLSRSVISN